MTARRETRLRVLWLTQIPPPALAAAGGADVREGPAAWVGSLASHVGAAGAVELTVAAPLDRACTVSAGGVTYVGLPSGPAGPARTGGAASQIEAVRRASALCRRWSGRGDDMAQVRAAERLARGSFADVIHVHGTEGPLGLVALGPCAGRVVVSLQGILTVCERSYFEGLTFLESARLSVNGEFVHGWGLLHDYRDMRRRASRERQVLRRVGHVMGRTGWDRGIAGILAPQAHYYEGGEVLRPAFYTTHRQDPGRASAPVVFTTASDLPWKGVEVLLAALRLLRPRHPSLRARIAGVPDDSELHRLHVARARREGVAASVEWLGRASAAQLADELAACDVFAYPSRADNSPNALCEAQLVGAPCVATYVGGIPSLVEDGVTGDLVPSGDPLALAAAIARLLEDRSRARGLAERAASVARRRHDPDAVVAQLVGAYRSIAGGAEA